MKNHDKYKNFSQYKLYFSQFILTKVKIKVRLLGTLEKNSISKLKEQ